MTEIKIFDNIAEYIVSDCADVIEGNTTHIIPELEKEFGCILGNEAIETLLERLCGHEEVAQATAEEIDGEKQIYTTFWTDYCPMCVADEEEEECY